MLCVTVGILFLPYIIKWISRRKKANLIINGKDANSLFDDEVVYDIMVACEYFQDKISIPNTILTNELNEFYDIEIAYYVDCAIKKLILFAPNYSKIFGRGVNQISFKRFDNIKNLTNVLIEQLQIHLDNNVATQYEALCNRIEKLKKF